MKYLHIWTDGMKIKPVDYCQMFVCWHNECLEIPLPVFGWVILIFARK